MEVLGGMEPCGRHGNMEGLAARGEREHPWPTNGGGTEAAAHEAMEGLEAYPEGWHGVRNSYDCRLAW